MQNPASKLIEKSGGHEIVAKWTGASITSVYRWTYPKDKGGTGGRVPQDRIQPWIEKAGEHGVEITLADFFPDPAGSDPEALRGDLKTRAKASLKGLSASNGCSLRSKRGVKTDMVQS